jgi:hypothetical protein
MDIPSAPRVGPSKRPRTVANLFSVGEAHDRRAPRRRRVAPTESAVFRIADLLSGRLCEAHHRRLEGIPRDLVDRMINLAALDLNDQIDLDEHAEFWLDSKLDSESFRTLSSVYDDLIQN